jgi:CheY-like chemotaxis protein
MDQNISTAIAYDGFEAGQLIYEIKPDLILLDLVMPGMDGYSVCERIKNNDATSDIRIIAMTGVGTEENIKRILNAGAESCLKKPIDVKALTEIIFQSVKSHTGKDL